MLFLIMVFQLRLIFEDDEALFLALRMLASEVSFIEVDCHFLIVCIVSVVLIWATEMTLEVVLLKM